MEHESFEDDEVASVMNQHFVSIKVDREERPDIDHIYMNACFAVSGRGGWPLNVVAMPDEKPLYAGTYFRKDQWLQLLKYFAGLKLTDPYAITRQSEIVLKELKNIQLTSSIEAHIDGHVSVIHAIRAAGFYGERVDETGGKPGRTCMGKVSVISGFLDDYSFLLSTFIMIYETRFDIVWIQRAEQIAEYILKHFSTKESGLFYFTSDEDAGLIEKTLLPLQGKLVKGKTLIYICRDKTCLPPLISVREALEVILGKQ